MSMGMMDVCTVSPCNCFFRAESWAGKSVQDAAVIDACGFSATTAKVPELGFQQFEFFNPLGDVTDMCIYQGVDF